MSKQTEFRGLSRRVRTLLSSGENKHVDYKKRVNGLHAEDLVAFANSPDGGAILIGVEEVQDANGQQKGKPVGCPIGDHVKLQIIGKAMSCNPPVQIEIFTENLSTTPFYRIEIPSGSEKPYATNNGTYKIREDGRNAPLLPPQLLNMFLNREGEEFRRRFSNATGNLETKMGETLSLVTDLEHVISLKIEQIASSMGMAEYEAGDAADTIERVEHRVVSIERELKRQHERVKGLLKHLEAADPIREKAEKEVYDYLVRQLSEDTKLLKSVMAGEPLSISGSLVRELGEEELNRLLTKAILEVQENEESD